PHLSPSEDFFDRGGWATTPKTGPPPAMLDEEDPPRWANAASLPSTTRLRRWMTVKRAPPSLRSAVGAESAVWLRSRTAPAWSKSSVIILTSIPRAPSSEQGGRPGAGAVSRWRHDALTDVLTRIAWGRLGLGCRVAPRSLIAFMMKGAMLR